MGDLYKVYILQSRTKNRFYTGYSDSLARRLDQHNQGKTPSTKYGIPWKLIWESDFLSKTEALKLERKIKKRGARRFIKDQNGDIEF